jgi:hypothetical protein
MPSLGKPPEELTLLQPFLQKAEEIEDQEKTVAYYCESSLYERNMMID